MWRTRQEEAEQLRRQIADLTEQLDNHGTTRGRLRREARHLTRQARRLGVSLAGSLPRSDDLRQGLQHVGEQLAEYVPDGEQLQAQAERVARQVAEYVPDGEQLQAQAERVARQVAEYVPDGDELRRRAAGLIGRPGRRKPLFERLPMLRRRSSWWQWLRPRPLRLSNRTARRLPKPLTDALVRSGIVERPRPFPWGPLLGGVAAGNLLTAAGWIVYSNTVIDHNVELPEALSGLRRSFSSPAGGLSYYVAGEGEPLLLIHSINAAASSYETRPLFEHYKRGRRVYALDLPGFGFSERGDRAYTPGLYTEAIIAMLDEIRRDSGSDEVDALAFSLSTEFLARAAQQQPHRLRSLALITPTGFGRNEQLYGSSGEVRGSRTTYRLFTVPLWRQPLFDLLTSKPSLNYFLSKSFGSYRAIDRGLAEYDYLTAHQPGASFAPYHFVSGLLSSADIDRVYESLSLPVWLAYGIRGDFSNVTDTANVRDRTNWTLQPFNTGGLPQFEDLAGFTTAYDAFLDQVAAR